VQAAECGHEVSDPIVDVGELELGLQAREGFRREDAQLRPNSTIGSIIIEVWLTDVDGAETLTGGRDGRLGVIGT